MRLVATTLTLCAGLLCAGPAAAAETGEVLVTATRRPQDTLALIGNTARLDGDRIALLDAPHIHTLGTQLPGVWLSRGSGQEHLTAIRSPVLTGPGSCGSFLVLEDGFPLRPTGFCNVNELFELPSELGTGLEVIRGPAAAAWGSNALHGTINLLLPEVGITRRHVALTAGPNRYGRAAAQWGGDRSAAGLLLDRDGGFRDESDFTQAKGYLKHRRDVAGGSLDLGFSFSLLDQETAGFIVGEDSYRDPVARLSNPNPESYRDADSQRLSARWRPGDNTPERGLEVQAQLRRSRMDFLQHFLPGKPTEDNGQVSVSAAVLAYRPLGSAELTAGLDLELARGTLREFQTAPETGTPPRPQGLHYDYHARQWLAAPWAQLELPLARRWTLTTGLRIEWLRYDYENEMLDGNTRDDGTACTPACLFSRPADRNDAFLTAAPNVGLVFRATPATSWYATLTRGFRAPQAAELYRLQGAQSAADLDAETLDSLELGVRWVGDALRAEVAAFGMEKRDYIFQDSSRFNVGDGSSRHAGAELQLEWRDESGWYAGLATTWSRQVYTFDRLTPGGEQITDGNDIDTAPRTLGSLHLGIERPRWLAEAEWVHEGRYYLTAAEGPQYPGHDLLNLRGTLQLSPRFTATLRLDNATDELYADRADYAFGDYRYFPARDRELHLTIAWDAGD
jgi:outer membrane receptor protein involved in Fe transport